MARKPTPASWKPGQSGNPKGRPPEGDKIVLLAREHTAAAIEALVRSLTGKNAVAAASALLDRGWGRPKAPVEHSGNIDVTGGIDAPPDVATTPESAEEWLERRRKELASMAAETKH
jgi:hypothetical protein